MVPSEKRRETSENPPAEAWGRRLRRGEAEAVHHVRERVRRILSFRRLKLSRQALEDLEQEIMTELWQSVNRPGFDFEAGFWGFVETVSVRRCIDWLRAKKTDAPFAESIRDTGENPYEIAVSQERRQIARQILEAMDPSCRKIVSMRLKDGMSYRSMARKLGRSEGALRVQMHRCIRSARDLIENQAPVLKRGIGGDGSDESS